MLDKIKDGKIAIGGLLGAVLAGAAMLGIDVVTVCEEATQVEAAADTE